MTLTKIKTVKGPDTTVVSFNVEATALHAAVKRLKAAGSAKGALPLMEYFHMEITASSLIIQATDLGIHAQEEVDIHDPQNLPAMAVIRIKALDGLLKHTGEEVLTVSLHPDTHSIVIQSDEWGQDYHYKYQIDQDPTDFPAIPEVASEEVSFITMPSKLLHRINLLSFAVDTDVDDKLHAVYMNADKESNQITMVGTDGHVLAQVKLSDPAVCSDFTISLDFSSLTKACKIIKDLPEIPLTFFVGTDWVTITHELGEIRIRMSEHIYPDWAAAWPSGQSSFVTIGRRKLQAAINRIQTITKDTTVATVATVDLDSDKISLQREYEDMASAVESIEITGSGDDIKIGFSAKYMDAILSHLGTENVRITYGKANQAMLIYEEAESGELSSSPIYILMPLLIEG